MNNFKKIGVSALAGSLAMVSANAIEYTMTGGMVATLSQATGPSNALDSGRGIGTATDLSFNASGELDNGFTVGYFMGVNTDSALTNSSSQMTIGMGSLGTLQINNVGGSKANAIDDITPNAYNETWDGLTASAANNNPSWFGSRTSSGSIDYRIPTQETGGLTINASVTYDPNADLASTTKGAVQKSQDGAAITTQIAHESGIEIGGGYEAVKNYNTETAGDDAAEGGDNSTAYIKFATGGLSLAYQEAWQNSIRGDAAAEAPDKKAQMMSIAYTMGDMSFSYGQADIDVQASSDTAALPTIELESIQAAYVMGAMTVSAAMSKTDNSAGTAANDYKENQLAVSFA
jgi:outer membrane protein OmpU